MNPQEKWDRMNHPQCVDDYRISMNIDEMLQVPAAAEAARGLIDAIERNKHAAELMAVMGRNARETLDRISRDTWRDDVQ